jgi:hypothetical protein
MLSVDEFARKKGIAKQRAYALVREGAVRSERVGNAIVIDESALAWEPLASRPLSPRLAWAVVDALAGQRFEGLSPSEASRVRRYINNLRESKDPDEILRAYLARRAPQHDFRAAQEDLEDLRKDRRLKLSGISAIESRMSAPHEVEAYVDPNQIGEVVKEYLLIPVAGQGNVRLRERQIASIDLPLVIADLIDWGRPREKRQAIELLNQLLRRDSA